MKASHTLRWSGGMAYLRRGKWMRGVKLVSGRGVRNDDFITAGKKKARVREKKVTLEL